MSESEIHPHGGSYQTYNTDRVYFKKRRIYTIRRDKVGNQQQVPTTASHAFNIFLSPAFQSTNKTTKSFIFTRGYKMPLDLNGPQPTNIRSYWWLGISFGNVSENTTFEVMRRNILLYLSSNSFYATKFSASLLLIISTSSISSFSRQAAKFAATYLHPTKQVMKEHLRINNHHHS